ncbi:substrate-binding periplasmic protein [Ornithinimicrobium cavernae]|uniref:substrate-binding periplasmic protein n=1 Tax=Ornithinimicrobium cavernae TaxID=2666047 RepID=UPI000D6931F1|nr:transporter substrate-binding domain-containing protein [Ornithinimicrobium cavernae]
MRTTSRTLASAAALTLLAGLTACGGSDAGGTEVAADCEPAHPDLETVTDGVLTVSVYVTPPYTIEEEGTYNGVDGKIIKKIAELECLEVTMQPIAAAGLIQSVETKRADTALGGIYRTPERAEILKLPATVYLDGMQIVAKEELPTLESLEGKTLGVIQGYLWTEDLQASLGSDAVKIYQASDGMINDLNSGRVDAVVLTNAEAAYRIEQFPDAGLVATDLEPTPDVAASQHPGEVVFPVPKGNTALAEAFSADIEALQEDGTVAEVLEEYGLPESSLVSNG